MDTDGVIQLFALLILVCLSAFFSSAETSLSTVNRVRLKTLAEEGNKRAQTALHVLDKYGKMLSAILICLRLLWQQPLPLRLILQWGSPQEF